MTTILTTLLALSAPASAQGFQLQSDLLLRNVEVGCQGSVEVVTVTVENAGFFTPSTWVDVYFDPARLYPTTYGDEYGKVSVPSGSWAPVSFPIPGDYDVNEVFLLSVNIDYDDQISESNEYNNLGYRWLVVPDCSFD